MNLQDVITDKPASSTASEGSQDEQVIIVEHLSKAFGTKQVLRDISLRLSRGENLVVLGKSGTGKSVLIKCIVRLIEPDAGSITVFDKDLLAMEEDDLNETRKKIGYVFQGAALYDSMTVKENLEFPLRQRRRSKSKEDIEARVQEALHNVGLEEAIDKMPSELSGGMQKRIGVARTLILRPEIILYDEPTTGLDPVTSREISRLILDVQRKYNTSSIIITHDIECAKMISNRAMILNEGVCLAEGTLEELQKWDDDRVTAFFDHFNKKEP